MDRPPDQWRRPCSLPPCPQILAAAAAAAAAAAHPRALVSVLHISSNLRPQNLEFFPLNLCPKFSRKATKLAWFLVSLPPLPESCGICEVPWHHREMRPLISCGLLCFFVPCRPVCARFSFCANVLLPSGCTHLNHCWWNPKRHERKRNERWAIAGNHAVAVAAGDGVCDGASWFLRNGWDALVFLLGYCFETRDGRGGSILSCCCGCCCCCCGCGCACA